MREVDSPLFSGLRHLSCLATLRARRCTWMQHLRWRHGARRRSTHHLRYAGLPRHTGFLPRWHATCV